jgi:hypothetical protein
MHEGAMTARRALTLTVPILVLGGLLIAVSPPAKACSCAVPVLRDSLAEADAAFIGVRTAVEEGVGGEFGSTLVSTFRVEHDLKGNLEDEVYVISSAYGGSCGLEVGEGQRVGLFLHLTDEGWTSSLCSQADPRALLRAAEPLPQPDGRGPIRFLVGGNMGEARVMTLDAEGRTLAYGYGDGDTYDVDVCPGGKRSVESVSFDGVGSLVVRDLATLSILEEIRVVVTDHPSIYEVRCLDEEATHLLAADELKGDMRIHEVIDGEPRIAFEAKGPASGVELLEDIAYVSLARTFGRVDIASSTFEPIVELPALTGGSARISPDGQWVAAVRYGGARPGEPASDIVLVPTAGGPVISEPLVFWNDSGEVRWLPDGKLLFLPEGEDVDRLAIYEVPSMEEVVGADDWYAGEAVIDGDMIIGLDYSGLVRVELGVDQAARTVRTFDWDVWALDLVPGELAATPSGSAGGPAASPVTGPTEKPDVGMSNGTVVIGLILLATIAAAFALRRRSATASGVS